MSVENFCRARCRQSVASAMAILQVDPDAEQMISTDVPIRYALPLVVWKQIGGHLDARFTCSESLAIALDIIREQKARTINFFMVD